VGIIGEAGVGKSRLLLELRGMIPEDEYTYLEGRCLHYGGSMPYLPINDILKGYFDIREEDLESSIKKKVRECMCLLDADLIDVPACLHELMSLTVVAPN
jgi:ABC-type glutathione transport system ATPase component